MIENPKPVLVCKMEANRIITMNINNDILDTYTLLSIIILTHFFSIKNTYSMLTSHFIVQQSYYNHFHRQQLRPVVTYYHHYLHGSLVRYHRHPIMNVPVLFPALPY